MYFVIHNSVVISKILKILQNFEKTDFYSIKLEYFDNNRHRQMPNRGQNGTTIFNILDNTAELWMTKYIIGEIFCTGGATLYKNPSNQTVVYF